MFRRIISNLGALGIGQGIQLLVQFLVPAALLAAYGTAGYSQWLGLTALAGSFLTLDFGIQSSVVNELIPLHHRREAREFGLVYGVGNRLLAVVLLLGVLAALLLPWLPWSALFQRGTIPSVWPATLSLMVLHIVLTIVLGYYSALFRVVQRASRGIMWSNFHRAAQLVLLLTLAHWAPPFSQLALGQAVVSAVCCVATVFDLRRCHPVFQFRNGNWNGQVARKVLKSSAGFSVFIFNNVLVFQAPILMGQIFASPEAVVSFSLGRTLFSTVRTALNLGQNAVAPEITRLHGMGASASLARLYYVTETLVLGGAFSANLVLFLFAPSVLTLWLNSSQLFNHRSFLLLAVISFVMSIKEHKHYFQYSTNQHLGMSLAGLTAYGGMTLLSWWIMPTYGFSSFLWIWLWVEALLAIYNHKLNVRLLFPETLSLKPPLWISLWFFSVIFTSWWLQLPRPGAPLWEAASMSAGLLIISFSFIGLRLFPLYAPQKRRACFPRATLHPFP